MQSTSYTLISMFITPHPCNNPPSTPVIILPLPHIAAKEDENQYGNKVEDGKAPEAISQAVSSLPPEQMFELMKQMKVMLTFNT